MTENETTPKPEVKINEQETPAPKADATTQPAEQPATGEQETPATGSEATATKDSVPKEQPAATETPAQPSDKQPTPEAEVTRTEAPAEPTTKVVPESKPEGETTEPKEDTPRTEIPPIGPAVDIESLKAELDEVKNLLSDIKTQTAPAPKVEPVQKVTRLEDLTDQQRADILVYGETFTDDNGNRVAPDMILKGADGSVHYVEDDDY